MIASDLVAELESRFKCVQGQMRAYSQTQEPYVDIGFEDWRYSAEPPKVNGVGPQPGTIRQLAHRRLYFTEDDACRDWLRAFDIYAAAWRTANQGETPTLYWRYAAPHIFWYGDESWRLVGGVRTPVGALKCRLVLSCRPVVEIDDAAYDAARTAQLERDLIHGGRLDG
jgi:hypothetical protein